MVNSVEAQNRNVSLPIERGREESRIISERSSAASRSSEMFAALSRTEEEEP